MLTSNKKPTRHTERQKNMTHNEDKNMLTEIYINDTDIEPSRQGHQNS